MSGLLKKIVSGAKLSKDDSKEMGFLDHLEELRWHVIRAGIAVIAISSVALMFQNEIFEYVIYAPKKPSFITYRLFCALSEATCIHPPELQLITREMGEQFFMGITVSLYIGLIVAFPYIFYEFWKFIKPGLYEGE
ncbi:MAG: twin-arginine translocase subunit TatC, partial [Saprospiraceae bacterium]